MTNNNIWFGLVEIEPIGENTIIEKGLKAFVNVAYKANSKKDFLEKIRCSFFENDYRVIDVDDIEEGTVISIKNIGEAEKIELLKDLKNEDYDFSWGIFHTYEGK